MSTTPDINPQSFYAVHGQIVQPVPAAYTGTDAVKASHCWGLTLEGQHQLFRSGTEQVIDAVRCRDLTIRNFLLEPGKQNAVTLKGFVNGYTLEDVHFIRHSDGAQDIDLGNWTDYDRTAYTRQVDGSLVPMRWLPKTTRGTLRRVRMADGSRVRVRCLYADRPAIEDSDIEWINAVPLVPNCIVVSAYFGAKRAGLLATNTPTEENAVLQQWELN